MMDVTFVDFLQSNGIANTGCNDVFVIFNFVRINAHCACSFPFCFLFSVSFLFVYMDFSDISPVIDSYSS